MADRLDEALDFAAQTSGLEFKSHQTTALRQLVQGHDIFVNLPTGFGKSIIFYAATIVLDFLNEHQTGEIHDKALVFVVLPLQALAVDQLDRVKKIGLNAADITTEVKDDVLEHSQDYSIIFASPETLCGPRGKELLKAVKTRCAAVFVDESHCIIKW